MSDSSVNRDKEKREKGRESEKKEGERRADMPQESESPV